MKKNDVKNKILLTFMLVCSALTVFALGSCKETPKDPPGTVVVEQNMLQLNKTRLQLSTFETFILKADGASEKAVWNSSNEDVATVVNGLVTACGAGEATISLIDGKSSVSCSVYVVENILSPTIKSDLDRNNNLFLNGEYYLDFDSILFNGKEYQVDFTYESSNESILSVSESGLIKANAVGNAFITVKAEWRGGVIEESYSYTVLENAAIINVDNRNIVLYSADIENFSTSGKINATLVENGEIVESMLNYESLDDNIVEVGNDGTLIARNLGEAEVRISVEESGEVIAEQFVKCIVKMPVVEKTQIVTLNKTSDIVQVSNLQIFENETLTIDWVKDAETEAVLDFADGVIDLSDISYGYYDFIYYTNVGKYAIKATTYVAPAAGTLLLSSEPFGVAQVASVVGSCLFDATTAWGNESGSMRLRNGSKAWASRISFQVANIEDYECIYFRVFASDEEGGWLYGFGDKTSSKELVHGWNTITILASEFEGWYKQSTGLVTIGYTNGPQNNVPGNAVDDAWISNIYGVNKDALEELIASLNDTLTEADALRVDEIVEFFALISDKDVAGKAEFIEKLEKFDGIDESAGDKLVAAATRVGVLQLSTNSILSMDTEFAYGDEAASLKIYNNNTCWYTSISFGIEDISEYEEISFWLYVENEYGGLIYDKNRTSGLVIEVSKGWNEIKISSKLFTRYYNEETKQFTMNYTSYNSDKTNQNSYWKSIWVSTVIGTM